MILNVIKVCFEEESFPFTRSTRITEETLTGLKICCLLFIGIFSMVSKARIRKNERKASSCYYAAVFTFLIYVFVNSAIYITEIIALLNVTDTDTETGSTLPAVEKIFLVIISNTIVLLLTYPYFVICKFSECRHLII